MYEAAALGIGVLISLMLSMNAGLEQVLGPIRSLLVIHVAGMVTIVVILLIRREKLKFKPGISWFYYCAGANGIVLTFLNNWTIGKLGVTLALTIGILGQLFAAALIDQLGMFGLPKRPFQAKKLTGFALVVSGVLMMTAGRF